MSEKNELRKAMGQAIKDYYISDEALDNILDAVIEALPDIDEPTYGSFESGYNKAIDDITIILQAAKGEA